MSDKTLGARIEDDLEYTMRRFIEADAYHRAMECDYREARRRRDDLREEAARLHRASLVLAGAAPDATSMKDSQVNAALSRIEERMKGEKS